MRFRLGSWAVATSSLLSVALIGCNPPIDEKKPDTPAVNAGPTSPSPAVDTHPATTTPTDAPKATDSVPAPAPTPAVEPPKEETKPAEPAAPK